MSWTEVLREDPTMARLIDRYGRVEITAAENPFERLCVSIINQQLSTASANAIRERVFDYLDDEVTPAAVLEADDAALREAGLSQTKISYLTHAAEAFHKQGLSHADFASRTDEAVIDRLTDIRGIGEWTAQMYLIFVLGREDVLPLGDLGIRNGMQQLYGDEGDLSRAEMREIADQWRPYRSYGVRYVWRFYETQDA